MSSRLITKNGWFVVRTLVRSKLRTKVRTTNEFYGSQSNRRDLIADRELATALQSDKYYSDANRNLTLVDRMLK